MDGWMDALEEQCFQSNVDWAGQGVFVLFSFNFNLIMHRRYSVGNQLLVNEQLNIPKGTKKWLTAIKIFEKDDGKATLCGDPQLRTGDTSKGQQRGSWFQSKLDIGAQEWSLSCHMTWHLCSCFPNRNANVFPCKTLCENAHGSVQEAEISQMSIYRWVSNLKVAEQTKCSSST